MSVPVHEHLIGVWASGGNRGVVVVVASVVLPADHFTSTARPA